MNTRIKKIRQLAKMTQEQFANAISVKAASVSMWESGARNPTDMAINSICREFMVNEEWLRSGKGDMFVADSTSELDKILLDSNATPQTCAIIRKYLTLPKETQDKVYNFVKEIFEGEKQKEPETQAEPRKYMTDEELHEEMDRQLALEKKKPM